MNIINRIINKIVKETRLRWYRSHSTLVPEGSAKYVQPVMFLGKGRVMLGDGNIFGFSLYPGIHHGYCRIEARNEDAWIKIGYNNHFNNNFTVVAEHNGISIGNDCLVGANVSIINSDFHPISVAKRHRGGAEKQIRRNRQQCFYRQQCFNMQRSAHW